MIAPGDEVQVDWVDIEMRKKVKNGQKFTVFSQSKPVINEDGDEMAVKLIRQGTIEIIDAHDDTLSTARVTQASREIERGMIIIPNEDLTFSVFNTPNTKSQEGRVIDTIDIITQLATEQFVIINRGREDGVEPGNRWVVFEQREGLSLLERGKNTQTQYAQEEDKNDLRNGRIHREDEQSWVLGREVEMHIFPERDDLDEYYGDRDYTGSTPSSDSRFAASKDWRNTRRRFAREVLHGDYHREHARGRNRYARRDDQRLLILLNFIEDR